jgi:hypothetical protein
MRGDTPFKKRNDKMCGVVRYAFICHQDAARIDFMPKGDKNTSLFKSPKIRPNNALKNFSKKISKST